MYKHRFKVLFAGIIFGVTPYIVTNQFSIQLTPYHLGFEIDSKVPLVPASVFIYIAIYVMVLIPLIMVENKLLMNKMVIGFIIMQYVAALFFISFPVHYPRETLQAVTNFSEYTLAAIHKIDKPGNCFPSLHVANSAYCAFITMRVNRPAGIITYLLFILIALSTLTTKQHYLVDVIAGTILAYVFYVYFFKKHLAKIEDPAKISNKFSHIGYFFAVYALMILGFYVNYVRHY